MRCTVPDPKAIPSLTSLPPPPSWGSHVHFRIPTREIHPHRMHRPPADPLPNGGDQTSLRFCSLHLIHHRFPRPQQCRSRQRSRSSSPSSSVTSPPCTRPVTPDPSECSYLSTDEPGEQDDEDDTPYDQDDQVDDNDHQDASEVETVHDQNSMVTTEA